MDQEDRKEKENVDMKIFEMKLQEAIKTEMESLQQKIQKEFEEEAEKYEAEINELHGAFTLISRQYDQMKQQWQDLNQREKPEKEREVELSPFFNVLSHIFAI